MTPNRERYLDTISREERMIREEIDYHKGLIKSLKDIFNYDDDGFLKNSWGFAITKEKTIISLLKKHLPAPTKSLINWHCNCPKCGFFVDGEEDNYCYHCGQKLR